MPLNTTVPGRRAVEMTIEVPGTPEQVWRAFATGPGLSAWFARTEIEEQVDGRIVFHLGPGMDSVGRVTVWEPPHRFGYEEPDWNPPAPSVVTDCRFTPLAGGGCRVWMEHSLATSDSRWDDILLSFERGWEGFFKILRIYLTHFADQPAAIVQLSALAPGSLDDAWRTVASPFGLVDAKPGDACQLALPDGTTWTGAVEHAGRRQDQCGVMVRLTSPSPAIAQIGGFVWEQQVRASVGLYFYGNDAATIAVREQPLWQAWFDSRFPPRDT